jgi:hypothetical protein
MSFGIFRAQVIADGRAKDSTLNLSFDLRPMPSSWSPSLDDSDISTDTAQVVSISRKYRSECRACLD